VKIGELNVGDLVIWKDPGAHPGGGAVADDMGIVLEVEPCIAVEDRIALAVIYWREEETPRHSCDGGELDDWHSRGILEVVSEYR
jgi:hypothetical protein